MSILGTLKNVFAPNETQAAKRRQDVFGTQSKAIVGGVIIGGAAAAIAAPAVLGATSIKNIASSAVKGFSSLSIPKQAAVVLAAPVVVGSVINQPKTVTRTVGGLANVEKNLFIAGKDPSLSNVAKVFKENPIIAGGLTAAGLSAAAVGVATIATSLKNTDNYTPPNLPTGSSGNLPDTVTAETLSLAEGSPSSVPVTRETQVLGKQAGSRSISKYKAKKKEGITNNIRLNILNSNKSTTNRKIYISQAI